MRTLLRPRKASTAAPPVSPDVAHLVQFALTTGLCGGYTTFSTATVESVRLARSGRLRLALANTLGTLLVTVLAAAAGVAAGGLFV